MEDCIFCKIIAGELPCIKIYEDEQVLAFGDINPVSNGHTLVIPKNHAENLWKIAPEDLTAVHLCSKKIIQAMKDALNPSGVACVQLNGSSVNQTVMHYHLHLIPRAVDGPRLPLGPWKMQTGNIESIKDTVDKIIAAL